MSSRRTAATPGGACILEPQRTRAHGLALQTLVWSLSVLAMWPASVCGQKDQPAGRELKLSTVLGPAYPQGKAGEAWASLIRERTNGRVAVRHFPGADLVQRDPARELAALQEGAVDLAVGSAQAWATRVKELNVFALPWIARNDAALEALIGAPDVRAQLSARLASAGVVAVAWAPNGFVELASAVPIHKPADLAGLKMRAPLSPLFQDTLITLGATPATMSAAEARSALADGTLRAEETSVAAFATSRSYTNGLIHLQLWGAHADALIFAVNRAVWDQSSAEDRDIIVQAAEDAARRARALAGSLVSDKLFAELKEEGVSVTRLTAAGKNAYALAGRAAYDRWANVVGEDLVRAAEAAVAVPNAR